MRYVRQDNFRKIIILNSKKKKKQKNKKCSYKILAK